MPLYKSNNIIAAALDDVSVISWKQSMCTTYLPIYFCCV